MPAPSPLSIATSSVLRLLKEEQTYNAEVVSQEKRVKQLQSSPDGGVGAGEDEDMGNRGFLLKQETQALSETKAIFGPLRERIEAATAKLKSTLREKSASSDPNEVEKAKEVLASAGKA